MSGDGALKQVGEALRTPVKYLWCHGQEVSVLPNIASFLVTAHSQWGLCFETLGFPQCSGNQASCKMRSHNDCSSSITPPRN